MNSVNVLFQVRFGVYMCGVSVSSDGVYIKTILKKKRCTQGAWWNESMKLNKLLSCECYWWSFFRVIQWINC